VRSRRVSDPQRGSWQAFLSITLTCGPCGISVPSDGGLAEQHVFSVLPIDKNALRFYISLTVKSVAATSGIRTET
jgi:hypothetical protein